ncbi:hypothetical protein E2C01_018231 [Portunus trituberculatus]|uniref:Uncharacterized protein n=1 Tax=Portunus trituberculatus TaxID=210409 RepID=A0A5B7DTZ8_PORTR|nr:hypothetical protein [Portunus trituberculatus]
MKIAAFEEETVLQTLTDKVTPEQWKEQWFYLVHILYDEGLAKSEEISKLLTFSMRLQCANVAFRMSSGASLRYVMKAEARRASRGRPFKPDSSSDTWPENMVKSTLIQSHLLTPAPVFSLKLCHQTLCSSDGLLSLAEMELHFCCLLGRTI